MKRHLLFLFSFIIYVCVHAQVAGPLSGKAASNVPLAGSSQAWIDVINANASDENYATFDNLSDVGNYTDYLVITGFGFSIPTGSQITGIVAYVQSSDENGTSGDYSVRIVKGGAITGNEHSGGAAYYNGLAKNQYSTYGGPGDLWGATWSAADIASNNFGIALSAQRIVDGKATGGRIDNVRVGVYYLPPSTLPLNMTSFAAVPKNEQVRVTWTTTDESNMDRFEVQRSSGGSEFKSFGTIMCKNLSATTSYAFTDYSPIPGTSSYRLKIIERSGSATFSKIVTVQVMTDNTATLYPSPWKKGESLFIHNPKNEKLQVQFYNNSGDLTGKTTTSNNQVSPENFNFNKGIVRYKVFNEKNALTGSGSIVVY